MSHFEEVTERIGGVVLASTVRLATAEEIAEAEALHREGRCPHTIVRDEPGWLYDQRLCVTCGAHLGFV